MVGEEKVGLVVRGLIDVDDVKGSVSDVFILIDLKLWKVKKLWEFFWVVFFVNDIEIYESKVVLVVL